MQFVGTVDYSLDKKRVPIPPAFRGAFRDGGYITTGTGPFLVLYTPDGFARDAGLFEAVPPETDEGDQVRRDFFGNAVLVQPDAQGRVLLSDRQLAHASLEREVKVVGVGRRLEIWDRAAYEAGEADRQAMRRKVLAQRAGQPSAAGA